jgi:hypothetical protein
MSSTRRNGRARGRGSEYAMVWVLAVDGCGTGIALVGIGERGGEGSCCLRRASLLVAEGEGGGVEKWLKRLALIMEASASEGDSCGVGN